MINHLRTLLLNISSSDTPPPDYPGEEFVPADYIARTLTDGLKTVHQLLFGIVPDRTLLNFRLRELLGLLHTSELAEFVYALDPRVTYWPPLNNSLFDLLDGPPVVVNVSGTKTLYVMGDPPPLVDSEKLYYSYLIEVIDATHVSVQPLTYAALPTVYVYSVSSGLSSLVPFPGSELEFRFESGLGSKWTATWVTYPNRTLTDVYHDLISNLTTDLVDDLFGVQPDEPLRTFKNLWLSSHYPPYRLGAVTLALGYQINNLVV